MGYHILKPFELFPICFRPADEYIEHFTNGADAESPTLMNILLILLYQIEYSPLF
jgi:hypothetical protein